MAILKDYIDQVCFEEIWTLLSDGRDLSEYRDAYQSIFQDLSLAVPQANTAQMTIRFIEEEPMWKFFFGEDDEEEESAPVLQVCGFVPGDDEGYAIGLKPASVLVGLDVDTDTAARFSPAEIVAHCMAEMVYTATMASSAYGTEKDTAGGGLLASQTCMSEDIQNIDLEALREQLGVLPKPEEDYKKKYGFLF